MAAEEDNKHALEERDTNSSNPPGSIKEKAMDGDEKYDETFQKEIIDVEPIHAHDEDEDNSPIEEVRLVVPTYVIKVNPPV